MRVLVVEDDRKVASFLDRGLRDEGYTVDVAHDGTDGALKAQLYDYDLLLLDVMLPGTSGLEIVREVRAAGEDGADPAPHGPRQPGRHRARARRRRRRLPRQAVRIR